MKILNISLTKIYKFIIFNILIIFSFNLLNFIIDFNYNNSYFNNFYFYLFLFYVTICNIFVYKKKFYKLYLFISSFLFIKIYNIIIYIFKLSGIKEIINYKLYPFLEHKIYGITSFYYPVIILFALFLLLKKKKSANKIISNNIETKDENNKLNENIDLINDKLNENIDLINDKLNDDIDLINNKLNNIDTKVDKLTETVNNNDIHNNNNNNILDHNLNDTDNDVLNEYNNKLKNQLIKKEKQSFFSYLFCETNFFLYSFLIIVVMIISILLVNLHYNINNKTTNNTEISTESNKITTEYYNGKVHKYKVTTLSELKDKKFKEILDIIPSNDMLTVKYNDETSHLHNIYTYAQIIDIHTKESFYGYYFDTKNFTIVLNKDKQHKYEIYPR